MTTNRKQLLRIVIITSILVLVLFFAFRYGPLGQKNGSPKVEGSNSKQSFSLSIDKIGITAPIITGIDPSNEKNYDEALKGGVLLMPGTGEIGKTGNAVIYGHSSSNELGSYNVIFTKLNKLSNGDKIRVKKDDKSYDYIIANKKIVEPNDLSVINQDKEEKLTLITCWPIGTDKQRLVIVAKRK